MKATMWVLLGAWAPLVAMAQPVGQGAPNGQPAATQPAQPGTGPTAAEDAKARRDRLIRATRLPKKAAEVRAKGVPDADVKEAMAAAKSKGVKAGEMADLTDEQSEAIDEHGPIDNFGAFVKTKLNEGLRGKELAAAITAEHAKRGKGKGAKIKPEGKGKPAPTGKSSEQGKPDDKTKPGDKGKPEESGKPDDKGKPDGKGKGR